MAKRQTIRSKIATKTSSTIPTPSTQSSQLPPDPKAFLHQEKATKKEKLETKRSTFLTRLTKSNDTSNISKSSLRRLKRKQKEELLPKMQDLLTSLESTTSDSKDNNNVDKDDSNDLLKSINFVESSQYIDTAPKVKKNLPSARNKRGVKIIENQERVQFGQVLKDREFKANPMGSLRSAILERLKAEKELATANGKK